MLIIAIFDNNHKKYHNYYYRQQFILLHPPFARLARAFFGEYMLPEPLVRSLSDGRKWLLEETYIYQLDDRTILIPSGFIFDFASIPRIAWRLFPPATGKHRNSALIHDWNCAVGNVSWGEAANIFLETMAEDGVNRIKRYTMYYAVKMFGLFHKQDKRQARLKKLQKAAIVKHNMSNLHII